MTVGPSDGQLTGVSLRNVSTCTLINSIHMHGQDMQDINALHCLVNCIKSETGRSSYIATRCTLLGLYSHTTSRVK